MLDRTVIRKEILLMGSKRGGVSTSEVSQTLTETEAVEVICIEFFIEEHSSTENEAGGGGGLA